MLCIVCCVVEGIVYGVLMVIFNDVIGWEAWSRGLISLRMVGKSCDKYRLGATGNAKAIVWGSGGSA